MFLLALNAAAYADGGVHAPPPSEDELVLAIPGPSPAPPPPPPSWRVVRPPSGVAPAGPPPGWREVGASHRLPDDRLADQRAVAIGGSVGGGTTLSVDALFRLSRSTVVDLGIGPALDRDSFEPFSNRLLMGLTWQPGNTTARHGIFGRVGLGFDERSDGGPNEGLLMAGYAWRLVPHDSPLTLEMEAAPGLIYREHGPYGEEWAALAIFARVGGHFWLR